jgi:hypothetical protein
VALSYEKSAAAYAAAAQDERLPIAARIASWKNSRSWYDRTRQVFVDLKGLDQLQPRDAAQIDKYSDKISLCETAMSELGSRHSSK